MPRDIAEIIGAEIPERKGPGTRIRILSERPMILDIHMATRSSFVQEIPGSHEGSVYVLAGSITAGSKPLNEGEVGRLDDGDGRIEIKAGPFGARAVLCAAQRQFR